MPVSPGGSRLSVVGRNHPSKPSLDSIQTQAVSPTWEVIDIATGFDHASLTVRVRAHPFDSDTKVRPISEGRVAATLSDRWIALGGSPNGGYVLAVALSALERILPHPDPLVVSAFFLRPARVGPATILTDVAHAGRRSAVGEARVIQDDTEVARATASFGRLDPEQGPTLILSEPPDLADPETMNDLGSSLALPGVTIVEQVEYRFAELPGWIHGRPSRSSTLEFWMRFKEERDPDLRALVALVDAAAPVSLELAGLGSTTMQLTVHVRAHPAPGWLACRVSTRHIAGGLHEEDFEIWDSSGTLVAQSRQLGMIVPLSLAPAMGNAPA